MKITSTKFFAAIFLFTLAITPLRKLLGVVAAQEHSYVTVRLVSDLGGPYVHSALIGAGEIHQGNNVEIAVADMAGDGVGDFILAHDGI